MDLRLNVDNQILSINEEELDLVNWSHNYSTLYVDFNTEEWEDKTKFILLTSEDKKTYLFNYTEEGLKLPSAVMKGELFKVSAYGTAEDVRITTTELTIRLLHSGYTTDIDDMDEDPTDVIADIYMKLDEKLNIVDYIIDTELDETSINPISNSAVTEAINTMGSDSIYRASLEVKASYRQLANRIRQSSS